MTKRARGGLPRLVRGAAQAFPRGGGLTHEVWRRRHRGILVLLWAHVPAVAVFALVLGKGWHGQMEAAVVAALAAGSTLLRHDRALSTTATSVGLLTCSAMLVHLSGGVIEVHFHFFVMVGVVVLYQEWVPFLCAIGYVVIHHGTVGILDPESVYNHPAAINNPLKWATIHGFFILGMSAAGIAAWRLNEALRRDTVDREKALAEAQRVAHLGSWEWDVTSNHLVWSDELYRLFGLRPHEHEVTFESSFEGVHADDRQALYEAVDRTRRTGEPFAMDFRIVRPDGVSRFLHARGAMVETTDGHGERMRGTVHDITDRMASEEITRLSEERYRSIIETTREGVWVLDHENRTTFANSRLAEMLGCSVEELMGASLLDFTDDEGRQVAEASLSRRRQGGEEQADLRFVTSGGEEMWALVSTSMVEHGGAPGRMLAMVSDITDRKQAEEDLAHQALHDHLTGLPNRALLIDRLELALARAERSGSMVAVIFLDLDRFKLVNDGLGHDMGDALLMEVAGRLRSSVRPADTVARFGGDEFVVLCEGAADERDVTGVTERILSALAEPLSVRDQRFHVSASLGLAMSVDGRSSSGELIRDADAAMYRAKEQGRGRYEIFDEKIRQRTLRRLNTEDALREALEQEQLRVHYQPIVSVEDGAVAGVEALVRWQHPKHGLVLPGQFIPVAEDSGLIVPIGAWVLAEATRQAGRWDTQLQRQEPLQMSVNLSARQLLHADLLDTVRDILERSAVVRDQLSLCLEVTESVLMEDPVASTRVLQGLKDLGIRIGIDDFGTGYSSLSYLKHFPFDIIKIDRAFVSGVANGSQDRSILAAILELARALGLTAVAEGVETAEQLAELKALGCELAQGFLFARPQPAEQPLLDVLRSGTPQPVLR